MKTRHHLLMISLTAAAGVLVWHMQKSPEAAEKSAISTLSIKLGRQSKASLSESELVASLAPAAGEDHSRALEIADRLTREQIQLSASQVRELMAFIRGAKPPSLEAGEWHHRVNSILNALRVQHEPIPDLSDFLMETALRKEEPVLS